MPDAPLTLQERLHRAQSLMETPRFDSSNPHFGNRFASLGEVTRVAKKALNAEGLTLHQRITTDLAPGYVGVETVISGNGESIDFGTIGCVIAEDPQKIGSALTYFRRYGLAAALAIVADDDDDAEAAVKPPVPAPKNAPGAKATPADVPHTTNIDTLRKKMFAKGHDAGLTDEQIKYVVGMAVGKHSTKDMTVADFDKVLTALDDKTYIDQAKDVKAEVKV